ncbi:hypothetical protein [Cellulomonas sp. S1-8]|uniref:hypothetical protein n=1 Tax=Cellulomonas sp. S1-8 TaxID=2904790 RepID=UPI00224473EC|nr:hypothetical protein [Cellulomonas sp. S1-8]UZN02428.1 hypothetical protein OKX07_15400 [Cellulomonas sp. S1-8]
MSTDRHPLDDALDDAERAGATYEVPLGLVRTRVRRSRRTRAAARGAVALTGVAAVALAVPWALGGSGRGPAVAQGDWPAQFTRCGASVTGTEGADDAGPLSVTIENARATIGADRVALVTTSVSADPGAVAEVHQAGTEVSLLRDGVVVGVEDDAAPVVVHEPELRQDPPAPGTSVWSFGTGIVSCAQYPDGGGDPRVPAGEYDLVVAQTVDWRAPDGRNASTVVSRTWPVTVTEDEGVDAPLPDECGGDAAELAAIAGPEANPFAVTLDADVPPVAAAGADLRFTVTATNEGTAAVAGWTGHPDVLLTRDGRVVGVPGASDDLGLDATMSPGTSIGFDAWTALHDCTTLGVGEHVSTSDGDPLPPGEYEVWVAMELFLTTPAGTDGPEGDRTDVRLVHGPWPLTLE